MLIQVFYTAGCTTRAESFFSCLGCLCSLRCCGFWNAVNRNKPRQLKRTELVVTLSLRFPLDSCSNIRRNPHRHRHGLIPPPANSSPERSWQPSPPFRDLSSPPAPQTALHRTNQPS